MSLETAKYNFLIQKHKNSIYSYALYMLRNKMDAEDAAQEVMIRVWKNMDNFKMSSAKTWILRTTHNYCIDLLRKRNSILRNEIVFDDEFSENFEDKKGKNNPYLITHFKMMTDKIKEAIKCLPENLRSVFVLYEIQGFKYKEISKTLDMPINSVKVYLLRARKKLQEELKNYEPQEVL